MHGALHPRLSQRGGYSQIRLARSRVRKLKYTALCIATKREYGLNDEFQMTNNPTETFTLGHSPDPDDAFMFYAIAKNKIDLRGYRFEHRLEDIQTLNERAQRGELHISAISIHAYAYVADKYALLPCGASMGDGYGPIVIRKHPTPNVQHSTPNHEGDARESLRSGTIAVPGKMTSAFLALQLFLGEFNFMVVPFDKIFDAVESGRADAGLIIHEGQLTYARSGFEKIVDLGEWWKRKTGLPLPLGGNVVRKDIPPPCDATSARSFAKASTTVSHTGTKPSLIRSHTHATWTRSSPANSSACT